MMWEGVGMTGVGVGLVGGCVRCVFMGVLRSGTGCASAARFPPSRE